MIITRFHQLQRRELTVEFLTPTFLGGADQNAELRSMPFKNLMRQWWRILNGHLEPAELLKKEGEWFGSVLDEKSAQSSKIRMFFSKTPENDSAIDSTLYFGEFKHPEVKKCEYIYRALYLGFGPVNGKRKYIEPGTKLQLKLCYPQFFEKDIVIILILIHNFGVIGGRSRNGYGSLALSGEFMNTNFLQSLKTKDIREILGKENKPYPNALGIDQKGELVWETKPIENWQEAMSLLAECYLGVRMNLKINEPGLQKRHILGYPVTHHEVRDWGVNARMPSQLRLMVKRNAQDRLVGRILHLPHKLPKKWDEKKLGSELSVWKKVHEHLDKQKFLSRWGGIR